MATVQQLLSRGAELPGDNARRDAEILLSHCLCKSRTWLYTWPEREVADAATSKFMSLLMQRRQGQPVAYLTGEREFWSLSLDVNSATLIPRPETETLVQWVLESVDTAQNTVLDLGTGSGAIALALASERPIWRIVAVDRSEPALVAARDNAARLQLESVRFLHSDWYQALAAQRFDLIVANPPYIAAGDPHLQQGDLRFEPQTALVSAQDGLADLAHIIANAPAHLNGGGRFFTEHGYDQAQAVQQLLAGGGFSQVETRRDLGGQARVSAGLWHAD